VETDTGAGFTIRLPEPIWIISRESLARWQLDRAVGAGATHEASKVRGVARVGDGWEVDTDGGAWRLGFLVGADGAASRVRRLVAPRFSVELVPARVRYPTGPEPDLDTLVLRFYEGVAGYLWDFPRLDHRSVGIAVADSTWQRAALDARIDEYQEAAQRDEPFPPRRAGAVIGTAGLGHGDFSAVSGPGFALLGDAAGLADPFTGEGIRNALRSASLLGDARSSGTREWARAYADLARATFAREFRAARVLRRSLSESGLGVWLIERARTSDLAYSAVAALLGMLASHEYSLPRFLRRWRGALAEGRVDEGRSGGLGAVGNFRYVASAGSHLEPPTPGAGTR
jgi:flavin-dependent dehydrogenase